MAGARGKSAFAKMLGISPSTYDYYECSRVPPAEILLKISGISGVDLRWLITGEASETPVSPSHPVIQRAAKLLSDNPDAAAPLAAFIDILAGVAAFPKTKEQAQQPQQPAAPSKSTGSNAADKKPSESKLAKPQMIVKPSESWIPMLGRSAAGVPQFWISGEDVAGLTLLQEIVARNLAGVASEVQPAELTDSDDVDDTVQIITLSAPDANGTAEFLEASALKRKYPDAFAVRIDGLSMAPEIMHGDIVILSPSAPAEDGKAAVVQIEGQIGVRCKLFRREGQYVHLVPINDQFPPQKFPASSVAWALRVLAKVSG